MTKNVFTVNLGKLNINDDHRASINKAIQTAVTNELAKIGSTERIAYIPVRNQPFGPILQGIIAWQLDDVLIKNLEQELTM